jgi:hypothetical protein
LVVAGLLFFLERAVLQRDREEKAAVVVKAAAT